MVIDWQTGSPSEWRADGLIFFAFEGSNEPLPGFRRWMETGGSWLAESASLGDFKGKAQQVFVHYGPKDAGISRVICAGLGPREKFDLDKLRAAAALALRKCRDLEIARPALAVSALEGLPMDLHEALEEAVSAALAGLYRYEELKSKTDESPASCPEALVLLSETEPEPSIVEAAATGLAVGEAIGFTRDLVSAPANLVTPGYMAEAARRLAERHGFQTRIIDFATAKSMGMGAFVAVAQGSREPAYVIILEHTPAGTEQDAPLVLIGKGITFDTGGISLKPSDKMGAMKQDMAGAAAVLGVFEAIGRTKLTRRVVGILPCTENMPDGMAYRPGDVLKTLSGKTVEVISTDAEGRLILCDAITY
ncbi:MAG: leucyl aminopeptidase family protein, partial [Acidobacteriota bacterium]